MVALLALFREFSFLVVYLSSLSKAAAIYRDIFYISAYRDIFLVISRYKRTWIYGDSRKNRRRKTEMNESHSADATSVGPHMHIHSNSTAVLRTYIL